MAEVTREASLEFHPLANLFPLIEGAEFDALVQDIKKNGLRKRIVIFDGKILDGRNRYRAAKAAGIKLTGITNENGKLVAPSWSTHFIDLEFEIQIAKRQTQDDALRFVLSANLHRRHLTDQQRAAIAADIANLGNGERKSALPIGKGAVSQAEAAKMLNTSKRAVVRATKRKKEDPAAHEAAKAGKVTRKPRTPKPATPEPKAKPEPQDKPETQTWEELAESISAPVGESILEAIRMIDTVGNVISKEGAEFIALCVSLHFGKLEDKYPKVNEYWYSEEHYQTLKAKFGQSELDQEPEPAQGTVEWFTWNNRRAAVAMKPNMDWMDKHNGFEKSSSKAAPVSTPKEPAVNVDEPAEPTSTPQEPVSPKGSICSDPERLKKQAQWRAQHSKNLYEAEKAGAAK